MLVWKLRGMFGKLAEIVAFPAGRLPSIRPAPAQGERAGAPRAGPGDQWTTWGAARDGARVVATRAQVYAVVLIVGLYMILVVVRPRLGLIICLELVTAAYFLTGL